MIAKLKFSERAYNRAVRVVAEQLIVMARADAGQDRDEVLVLVDNYSRDALYDIQQAARTIIMRGAK